MTYLLNTQSKLDRHPVFDLFFNEPLFGLDRPNDRRYHVDETEDSYELKIECPGFKKSEISISYEHDTLTILAESNEASNIRSTIKRSFEITNIDLKKSNADLANGILSLTLQKTDLAKRQQLKIK